MKLKSILFAVVFSIFGSAVAANLHMNPNATPEDKQSATKNLTYPGYCEIEIINDSFSDLRVYGQYDDGATISFDIYRYEYPHYISLFYNFYCHSGMYLTIQTPFNTAYQGWASTNSTIRIVPFLKKEKAVVTSR
jgi:hypothetical protein